MSIKLYKDKVTGKYKRNNDTLPTGAFVLYRSTDNTKVALRSTSGVTWIKLQAFGNITDSEGTPYTSIDAIENALGTGFFTPSDEPWALSVTSGKIPGMSVIDKFGKNPLVTVSTDPEDIWEGGGTYPHSLAGVADIISLSSSVNEDTQPISIQGLDINGVLVDQEIILQGQTRVLLTTPLWRVFRMENEADEGGDLAGVVYCYSGTESALGVPSGASVAKAIIVNGNNQTLMALYTIPKGKVGFLFRGELGMNYTGVPGAGTNFVNSVYRSRRVGKIFKVKKFISLINQASSNYQDERGFPDPIPAFTDIVLTADEVSEDLGIWGSFCILLKDEDLLSDEYLAAIGQPTSPV